MKLKNLHHHIRTLAARNDCQVEVVSGSALLMAYGGAGCLLRYFLPEQYTVPIQEGIE